MEEKAKKIKEQFSSHKRASKVIFIVSVFLVLLVALSIVTSILLLLFPVGEIEVSGNSRYSGKISAMYQTSRTPSVQKEIMEKSAENRSHPVCRRSKSSTAKPAPPKIK